MTTLDPNAAEPVGSDDAPSDPLAGAAAVMAAWRGLAFDLPLTWTMELSRFAGHELESQLDHWRRLTRCTDLASVVAEETRFVRASAAEVTEEAEALAREARVAVALE